MDLLNTSNFQFFLLINGTTSSSQSVSGSNGNKGVLHTPNFQTWNVTNRTQKWDKESWVNIHHFITHLSYVYNSNSA